MYSLIYSLIGRNSLSIISTPAVSYVFDYDIFLAGVLLATGLFVLISHRTSRNYPVLVLIAAGLACSAAAYLVQTYMSTWYPELFIPGGPYGTWFGFRNDLSRILGYAAILLGALVPAWFIVPRIRLSTLWNALLLFGTLTATTILYYSYVISVTMTPGNSINVPEWLLEASPFLAAVAIAAGILGWIFVLREIVDRNASRPVRIAGIAAAAAAALFFTYLAAVAVYAVLGWLLIAKSMNRPVQERRVLLAVILAGIGAAAEITGSCLAAMGPDAGRFVPVWVFPVVFMALVLLVPALWLLPTINPKYRIVVVFGVSFSAGCLIALISAVVSPDVFLQPNILPQNAGSVAVNMVLGTGIAAILYSAVQKYGRDFWMQDS
jgi:hypothetical protein